MDKILEQRYEDVFNRYTQPPSELNLFNQIKSTLQNNSSWLRPDAQLILLTLFDKMILQAYAGQRVNSRGEVLPPIPLEPNAIFRMTVLNSLDHILDEMRTIKLGDERASSHDALKAIEKSWEYLAARYFWS